MKKYRYILPLLFLLSLSVAVPASAKTILTDLPRADWAKYGINPWKIDTDNDGFSDKNEILDKYCPTSADPISLTDKNCKRGKFTLATGVYTQPLGANFLAARDIKKFRSCTELTNALQAVQKEYATTYPVFNYGATVSIGASPLTPDSFGISQPAAAGFSVSKAEYSTTNIQVEGVDEGDRVKTDGQRIYYLTDNKLIIASADPYAREVLSTTKLDPVLYAESLYLSGSRVIVVGRTYADIQPLVATPVAKLAMFRAPRPYGSGRTVATIIDVSRPSDPTIVRSIELSGRLVTSRLTGGYLYLALNATPSWYGVTAVKPAELLPQIRDLKSEKALADLVSGESSSALTSLTNCADVEYLSPRRGDGFLEIVAIPVADLKAPIGKKVIWGVGSGTELYASPSNIYIAAPNNQYSFGRTFTERTELYKFSFSKNTIKFVASQTVPGTVLNQFSMDEYKGLYRLVTTERTPNGSSDFVNHLIVLNDDLSRLSSVDKFAPTEKIYSARFMGNRAYVVTFRTVDPFIVFDLTDPRSPQYIGELKIPGFSNYLHPYDDKHVIGIGKNTGADDEGFVWTEGLKLGLFDVTNPNIPTQMFSVTLGDRGSDSPALSDHHAFLFSKEKNLLALPVTIRTLTDEQKQSTSTLRWEYGNETFQGLIAFNLDLQNGFKELGRATHMPSSTPGDNYGYYNDYYRNVINRSLYIGDKLYALSDGQMTVHSLWNMMQLGSVWFR